MAFQPANWTLILRGLTCLLTLAGLVLLLAAVAPGTAAATGADVPEAPRNLRVSPGESGELVVSWEAPAGDGGSAISGYQVQWKSGSEDYDGAPESTRQAVTGNDRLTHTIGDLKDGTAYTVRVIATNGVGDGAPSAEATAAPHAAPTPEGQPAGPRDDSGEDGVYTWRDGDRIMTVRLDPSGAAQKSPPVGGGKGIRTVELSDPDTGPVFRSESGGGSMTLPGGVLLVLDPSWTGSDADAFFSRNGIKRSRVKELTFTKNSYFVETAPGLPSLHLANSLAEQEGVEISSPNWMSEEAASQGNREDDGDTIETATDLPLNTKLEATLHAPGDVDFFRIELTEPALVLIADIDSDNVHRYRAKFTMLGSSGVELPNQNFFLRGLRWLDAGVYYIKASEKPHFGPPTEWPYNIQAITIPDHGDTFESAASLNLMAPYDPLARNDLDYRIYGDFHSTDDEDFFKIELSADAEVTIYVQTNWAHLDLYHGLGTVNPVNVDAFDAEGNPLHPPIPGLGGSNSRSYSLEAGTYYLRLSPFTLFFSNWVERREFDPYYSLLLYVNAEYVQFIDDCSSVETNFDDPLLGCQGHLPDVNVEDVWATNKGEGINVAVVDVTMDSAHADLRDNVNEALNHDYTEEDQIINLRDSHGTAVAGVIAARDNDLGVRGLAPRATIYNYNYLEKTTTANLVDAITRNKSVTAISNNSYVKRSRGNPIHRSQVWNLALETGVSEGFDGKGTFYVFAAGFEHLDGGHINLREDANFYAQTTVCVVDSEGQRVDYSETGYALWVCAPMAEVTADNWSRYRYDFGGTSSAAPVVSGVAALVRSANPSLTWRDVKLVLAASARQNDPANPGWEEGALEYGSETESYSYNPEYGFGVVDARAAVDLAESWTNLPPMETAAVRSGDMELTIPDASDGTAPTTVSSRLTLGPEVGFTEFVEVHIEFDHPSFRDLEVELRSPTGTVSKLAVPYEGARERELRTTFRFGSARHLGEDPSGEWTLKVTDHLAEQEGSVRWWGIKVYGHGEGAGTQKAANSPATGAPSISGSVRVGHTLSADVSGVDDWNGLSAATFSYQWIRYDRTAGTDIPGATEATYTLVAEDQGHAVKLRVTFTDNAGYLETVTSRATVTVTVGPPGICDRTQQVRDAILRMIRGVSDCSKVSIRHLDRVWGELVLTRKGITALQAGDFHGLSNVKKLRLDQNDLEALPEGVFEGLTALRVVWLHSNPGAPFTLTVDLERRSDTAVVARVAQGAPFDIETTLSATGGALSSTTVTIRGGSTSSDEITVIPDGDAPVTVSVVSASFRLKNRVAPVGINVRTGGPVTLTGGNTPATGAPSITGTVQVGETLTADTSGIADDDGLSNVQYKYQWLADDAEISGATGLTYTLVAEDEGKAIKVRVSFTDDAGNGEELTSEATGAVAARPNSPATGLPTISGTAVLGQTLTADTSGIQDANGLEGVEFSYQWYRSDGTANPDQIDGATSESYSLKASDVGNTIWVRVSFGDDDNFSESLTSAQTATVAGDHGDTPATATELREVSDSVVAEVRGVLQSREDQDWFRLSITQAQAGYLSILLIENARAKNTRIALYDSSISCLLGDCETDNGRLGTTKAYLESGVYYLRVTASNDYSMAVSDDVHPNYRVTVSGLPLSTAWYDECAAIETGFADPFYGCQTHLFNNPRYPGEHINVEPVWDQGILGEGINVAVVDTGVDYTHEDLGGVIDLVHSTVYPPVTGGYYSLTYSPTGSHGIAMASIIGAQHNSRGIRGIAPMSRIYSYNGPSSVSEESYEYIVKTLNLNAPDVAVSSNSWSFKNGGLAGPGERDLTAEPIVDGITRGFHGKGTVYVFSASYPRDPASESKLNSNGSETQNFYAVITACGVGRTSRAVGHGYGHKHNNAGYGANLWVCAPYDALAAALNNGYRKTRGTSPATAIVSGVAALTRSANPELTWRDVKLILAASARQNDTGHEDWATGAVHYGGGPDRYHFNPNFGFGVVDAAAAVALAKTWVNLPPMTEAHRSTPVDYDREIPEDLLDNLDLEPLQVSFGILDDGRTTPQFVEHVEISVDLDHESVGDLDIWLTSPSGTVSRLAWPTAGTGPIRRKHSFGSSAHLGENPVGQWTLSVIDRDAHEQGQLKGASITIRGHRNVESTGDNSKATGEPTISGTAQVGQSLAVDTSGISDGDGLSNAVFLYQWIASDETADAEISNATEDTYMLEDGDAGKTIWVRVTFADDEGNEEMLTSTQTEPVAARPNTAATGLPTISGVAQMGETLTVSTSEIQDDNGLTGATFSYQWVSSDGTTDTDIQQATGSKYDPVASDIGRTIQVRVTFTDDGGNEETLTSAPTAAVEANPNTLAIGLPTISGKAQVGETLTADTSGIEDADGMTGAAFSYQWLADDTAIDGATGSAYTLADSDKGKTIRVRVTFTDDGGNEETLTSAASGPVLREPVSGDGPPGAPRNLTVTAGDREITLSWEPPEDNGNPPATRYRIERRMDGKDYNQSHWGIARKTTYTKTHLANGVTYIFRVKAENGSGNDYGPYGPPSEEVSGTPTSGLTVDLATPVLSEPETLHHGMVQLDWEDIEDAGWYVVQYYHVQSGEWLDLPAVDVDIAFHGSGAVVSNLHGLSWLRVRAMSCAGESEWSQIEQLFGTNASDWDGVPVPEVEEGAEIEPCPVVLGTPVLSEPETLHDGMVQLDWQDIEDAGWYVVQYYHVKGVEWLDLPAVGVDIAFHGSSAVVSNLHGLSWLRVRAMSCAGESEWSQIEQLFGTNASDWDGVPVPEVEEGDEIEVCPEDADMAANSPATGAPAITGTAQVGETLTADKSGIADADGLTNATYSYQWLADDSDISGATNATYTLVAEDESKAIKVRVSFTDDAGNDEALTSAATAAVTARPNSPATGAPTITGTAQVGETLAVDISGIVDEDGLDNAVFSYQWLADDADIDGATGSSYTLADADAGKKIKVRVSFTDDGDNMEELTSAVAPANNPATGVPIVNGIARMGEILTVDFSGISDADGMESSELEYYWFATDPSFGGTLTLGGTESGSDWTHYSRCSSAPTCIVVRDHVVGSVIWVKVYFTDDAGNLEELSSEPTERVKPAPAISGEFNCQWPQVGKEYFASTLRISEFYGIWNRDRFNYQWIVNDGTGDSDIEGETERYYTPTVDVVGKRLRVRVSFTDNAGNPESSPSESTWSLIPANTAATGVPVISGTAKVGETLTGSTDDISDADGLDKYGFTYIWTAIDPNTGAEVRRKVNPHYSLDHDSYTIRGRDLGMKIRLSVSILDDLCNDEKAFSAETEVVAAANSPATGEPTISGTARVGETLTADTSGIAAEDGLSNVQYEYQWLADEAEIAGATGLTYTLADNDEGKVIKVTVSFTDDAGNGEALTSGTTEAVAAAPTPNTPATGAPTISGTVQVGETLTAGTSGVVDADGLSNVQYEYQWLADDSDISGATNATYTLIDTEEGKGIKVRVSFTDDAGNEETLTSEVTAAVAAAPTPNSPATGAPTITGTAQVGETLTADTSGIADADGLSNIQYEYQWLADDSDISGATNATYTLIDTDEGKTITVRVSFTDDAGNGEALTSAATDAVVAAEPLEPPAKPRGLSATATHDRVVLTWDDPQDDSITGYVILRRVRENDQGGEFSELVADTGTAATTYTDDTVAARTTYTYRIKAINEHGVSERSRWVHIDTPAPPVPDQPTGLEATASYGQVVLTWDDPEDDSITGYVILRRVRVNDTGGDFSELVANTGSAATTYTDNTVAASTTYTYRIKAINEHGVSERSRWVHIDTPAAPDPAG